jgi:uncharacterized protein YkwD
MDRGTRTAAAPGRRARFLLSGVAVLAVLAGGLYLARGVFSAPAPGTAACAATVTCAASAADLAVAVPPAVVTVPPSRLAVGASRPAAAAAATRSASSRATGSATGTASTQPATPPASSAASSPSASSPASQDGTAATQVLALINQARASSGLPALTVTSGLEASSAAHNLLMAGGCGLSHQCPGEPALGARETAAGVLWTAAGENIGEGGPVASTGAAVAQMAVSLTQSMLNEQPPDDGHRMNILSSSYTHIGIAVYRDSSGTVWLTQDFSN